MSVGGHRTEPTYSSGVSSWKALAFLLGFWSLAGQFVYNRIIFFYIANSENAAASIISLHLLGFLVGSLLARRVSIPIPVLIALGLLLTPVSQLLVWTYGVGTFGLKATLVLILVFAFLLAANSGLLLVRMIEERSERGSASGIVIGDSLGSVAGAVIGGFFLVPKLGLAASFALIAGLQAIALLTVALSSPSQRAVTAALATLVISGSLIGAAQLKSGRGTEGTIAADGLPVAFQFSGRAELIQQEHTPFGVLSVVQDDTRRQMFIDTRPLCSIDSASPLSETSHWFEGQTMARLAAEGEGAPQSPRIAMVGLGCGTTLAGLLDGLPQNGSTHVDVIDINPGIRPMQAYFKNLLPHSIEDARTSLIIRDGFTHFTAPPDQRGYDAIMMDVVWMQNMNATHLFSQEMFANMKNWLTPRGVISIWTEQNNPFSPVSLIIYKTLKEVFPLVYVDTSFGTVIFFASVNTRSELEAIFEEGKREWLWMEDAARHLPINRLDNLAMNNYRFDTFGYLTDETLANEYGVQDDIP